LPSPTVGLVAGEGIEPPCAVCRTAVLPLNEPAVGRGGGNRTRIARLMGPPRSPSLPSAAVNAASGGPGGNRTLISWVQATDPPVERRAHPGEDNGTRTRTPALTTRRLSLRLCPPQDGRLAGIRTPICTVWACRVCRLRHEPTMSLVPPGGLEPPPHGLRARCAAFTPRRGIGADPGDRTRTSAIPGPQAAVTSDQRLERTAGLEPAPQGLEGPRATVTPHSRWFGLRVSNPSLRAGNAGCILHTQAERGPVSLTGPSTFVSYQRPRSCEHIRSYRPLATAPGFEPGPTRFGGSDASVTPRCRCCFRSRPFQRQNLPMT
jgi:hypothetical protein